MNQPIVDYHLDAENHWVADLRCGHSQHVRHDPPWQSRPWVTTSEGRAAHIGMELNCVICDRRFRCKAILFDLDGVLVDSAELVERTWRNWATRHRLDPETVIAAAHGRRTLETVKIVAPQLAADADAEVTSLEANEAMSTDGIHEIEGAREILEQLPPGSWAIVTSGIRAVAEHRIVYTRLPTPRVMICAEEIEHGKPHPEGYLTAAARLGRAPGECIVIEDAPPGIEAAHAAGMRVIAIASTYSRARLTAADAIVERISDLRITHVGDEIVIDVP